jgi:hypothetical protein
MIPQRSIHNRIRRLKICHPISENLANCLLEKNEHTDIPLRPEIRANHHLHAEIILDPSNDFHCMVHLEVAFLHNTHSLPATPHR